MTEETTEKKPEKRRLTMTVYEIRQTEGVERGKDSWIADFQDKNLATEVLNVLTTRAQREPASTLIAGPKKYVLRERFIPPRQK
jgi:hypothetical protein